MKRFITCLAAVTAALAIAAPAEAAPAKAKTGWTTVLSHDGGRWQGCLVSPAPNAVIKLRANNFGSKSTHTYGFGTMKGGPSGKYTERWSVKVTRGEFTAAKKFTIADGDLLSFGMSTSGGSGLGTAYELGNLRRC
jgi:hypothetical protein